MEEQKTGEKKYYEAYLQEGNHLPSVTDEDGYQAAISFSDSDNRLTGPLRIKEIDLVDERKRVDLLIAEYERETAEYNFKQRQQRHTDYVERVETTSQLIQSVSELIPDLFRFGVWCKNSAYPTIKNRTLPWIKQKVSKLTKHENHAETTKEVADEQPETEIIWLDRIEPEVFWDMVNEAHYQYKTNVSDEVAQQRFLRIMFLASELAKEIRAALNSVVVPDNMRLDEAKQRKWRMTLEKIATEKLAESINEILQSDPPLLMEPSAISFYQALGGRVSEDNALIPIEYQDFREALSISESN